MVPDTTENGMSNNGDPGRNCASSRRNPMSRASTTDRGASGETVEEIVVGCRSGDRSAQWQLYDTFHRKIYRLMVRMVGANAAPDVTQQVFLRVFLKIDQYAGRGRFDRWLYRLAVNEAFQHLRRDRREQHHPLVYEPTDKASRSDERIERKDLMEQALARLDPELRSICLLREIEELSYREIAHILEIPEGTVGSRLNRARRELKQHLINLGWEP